MNALMKLLEDNADPSNARHDMLTGDEVSAIVEALNAEVVLDKIRETIDKMRETYERRAAHWANGPGLTGLPGERAGLYEGEQ